MRRECEIVVALSHRLLLVVGVDACRYRKERYHCDERDQEAYILSRATGLVLLNSFVLFGLVGKQSNVYRVACRCGELGSRAWRREVAHPEIDTYKEYDTIRRIV